MKRQLIHTADLRQTDGFSIRDLKEFAADAEKLGFSTYRRPVEVKLTRDGRFIKELKLDNS